MARMPVYNLEWQEPPTADQEIIDMILGQLQNNPGKWARICRDRSSTALAQDWMKKGTEAKAVRATAAGVKPVRYDIYARWPLNKTPTIALTLRNEIAKSTAAAAPPSQRPAAQAAAQGRALTPPAGGYLAARAARGVSPEGNPV